MIDDRFDPIETSSGERPRASMAERGAVGLALLALVGGLLIAAGNVFKGDEAKPSIGPVAQASPTATPLPTPPPLAQVILERGSPPPASPSPFTSYYSGWIRATTTVVTHDSPALDAGPGATMAAGEVAYADQQDDGWFSLSTATGQRWIEPAIAASAQVQRVQPQPYLTSGYVWGLTAGNGGFLAYVAPAGMSDGSQRSMVAFSRDGVHWQATDLPATYSSFAYGPAGWLAVATDYARDAPTITIWQSADGQHWKSLGYAPRGLEGGEPAMIVGSRGAYLISTYGRGIGSGPEMRTWWSVDGVTWRQNGDALPGHPSGSAAFVGMPSGFYTWDSSLSSANGAFSADGSHWLVVDGGPAGQNVQIVQVGPRFIAMAGDPASGALRSFTGTSSGQTLVWDDPAGSLWPQQPAGIGLAALVSDGERAFMFAWNRATDGVLAWDSPDGADWQQVALPEKAFGGIPHVAAGGPTGIVVLGYRQTARGENPIFWHRSKSGAWAPEPSPLVNLVPDPSRDNCPAAPQTGLDFAILDRALAVACLGSQPITFQTWSVICDGCTGHSDGTYEPWWLAAPEQNQLFVSPIDGGSSMPVVLPALGDIPDPSWTPKLLELTGHFDDPAAPTCRFTPTPDQDAWYPGQRGFVDVCRQQFVLTAVKIVGSP